MSEKTMRVKYNGPMSAVNVAPYGDHWRDQIKEYPEAFAKKLIETSKFQKFEILAESAKSDSPAGGETAKPNFPSGKNEPAPKTQKRKSK